MTPYYDHSGIQIYHADCRDVLPMLKGVDLVLTDPPYGTTNNAWDSAVDYWNAVPKDCPHVVFSAQPFTTALISGNIDGFCYDLVWRKSHPTGHLNVGKQPMRQHEIICVFGSPAYLPAMQRKHAADVRPTGRRAQTGSYNTFNVDAPRLVSSGLTYPKSVLDFNSPNHGEAGYHPTQKPLALIRYLLNLFPAPLTVDPFGGSGTTAAACKQLGRKCILIEIEETYAEIAARRLDATPYPLFTEPEPVAEQGSLDFGEVARHAK